jgi:hypothetical protein
MHFSIVSSQIRNVVNSWEEIMPLEKDRSGIAGTKFVQ